MHSGEAFERKRPVSPLLVLSRDESYQKHGEGLCEIEERDHTLDPSSSSFSPSYEISSRPVLTTYRLPERGRTHHMYTLCEGQQLPCHRELQARTEQDHLDLCCRS